MKRLRSSFSTTNSRRRTNVMSQDLTQLTSEGLICRQGRSRSSLKGSVRAIVQHCLRFATVRIASGLKMRSAAKRESDFEKEHLSHRKPTRNQESETTIARLQGLTPRGRPRGRLVVRSETGDVLAVISRAPKREGSGFSIAYAIGAEDLSLPGMRPLAGLANPSNERLGIGVRSWKS